MTASLPWLDTTVSFSLPFSIWKMESAGSPCVNTTSPLRKSTVVLPAPTLARNLESRMGLGLSFRGISSRRQESPQHIFSRFQHKSQEIIEGVNPLRQFLHGIPRARP